MNFVHLIANGNYCSFNRDLAREFGLEAAVLLGELAQRQDQHGAGFFASESVLQDSTTLSPYQIRKACGVLAKAGVLLVERKGLPARNHYTISSATLVKLFESLEVKKFDSQLSKNLTTGGEVFSQHINNEILITNNTLSDLQANTDGVESEKDLARRVIDHLNEKSGKSYRYSNSSINAVLPRLREGFTVGDCFAVIDYKCDQWNGTEQEQYLRPSTLFRACNFEGYLQAAKSKAPSKPKTEERWKSAKELETEKRVKSLRTEMGGKDLAILATEKPETVREAATLGVITQRQFEALKTVLESAERAKAAREQAEKLETMLNLAKSNGLDFVRKYCHGVTEEDLDELKKLL